MTKTMFNINILQPNQLQGPHSVSKSAD